ncbi:uncharacterized protein L969DRAFT_96483 [Mixia osmundae IAM 14324]|uniref:Pheromone-processing carboxypeptidase KEX1 n=1 Tax=Mixia osmundae (strain CBS 9802 / IAM 14324 / JCM 22182 / KY 12970) TaxID=764103 RepID=G7DUW7_MIXOS|nr:uncharacterized protein L969DRAFT_96483 [Mixia osmundae IAM 14324]KEI37406.1 hypothetical protein L969DRAFT_96483 [Mixia osmundae IAM 14324]GAA94377.1 hypothetical protein E5Q_01028 [Mixia osmundae IAM 14324]
MDLLSQRSMHAEPLLSLILSQHEHYPGEKHYNALKKRNALVSRQDDDGEHLPTAADLYIKSLPGLPSNSTLQMWSGEIPSQPLDAESEKTDAHIFFLLVRNRHIADKERLVIWFNGGPACSSFDGALMEVGPVRVQPGGDALREVDDAWNTYANVLFVDQPPGTGYSYVSTDKYLHELDDASNHLISFLKSFYEIFPEYRAMDTYLAGESFAGQYIPYFANAILQTTLIPTRLQGLLIGNGWIDPYAQYLSYLDFAYENKIITKGSEGAGLVEEKHNACNESLQRKGRDSLHIHENDCEPILSTILGTTRQTVNGKTMCINTYDIRLTDEYPSCGMGWPSDLKDLYKYLPREDVKSAFHAGSKDGAWVECSGPVGTNFHAHKNKPSITLLPKLLEQIPILLFSGDQDLICHHLGTERSLADMTWNGAQGLDGAEAQSWWVDGKPAGTWTEARNLTYVLVANASHMIGVDVPVPSHDMLLRFLGADLMSAAGSAARVPSRIGDEQEAIIGEIKPDGSTLNVTADATSSSNGATISDTSSSQRPEAVYNAGSAAVILLIVAAAVGAFWWMRGKRPQIHRNGVGSYKDTGSDLGTPYRNSMQSNRASRYLASKKGNLATISQEGDDQHELDELVIHQEDRSNPHESTDQLQRHNVGGGETLFALADSDEEGDIGREDER